MELEASLRKVMATSKMVTGLVQMMEQETVESVQKTEQDMEAVQAAEIVMAQVLKVNEVADN